MQKLWMVAALIFASIALFSCTTRAEPYMPGPSTTYPEQPEFACAEKAWRLFELARRENGRLRWDECLAVRAMRRARLLVQAGYFEHRDPSTGENEAWRMVETCHRCRYAGENLTKGYQSAEDTHEALMASPQHRRNILDPRYQLLGVGCHDYVCVQLFAGS